MQKTITFDMERGIARCRVVLSLVAILALYVDPTEPTVTRWLPLTGGAFTINRYWATVLVAHLAYSLTLFFLHRRPGPPLPRLAAIATWGDVLFAAAIALVTEGTTSPFYSFFAFAVLAAGLRSGLRAALLVTGLSVGLYALLIIASVPSHQAFFVVMRAAYIAITGYLVGYLGQERINQEARIRLLQANQQREQIARSLHDGYAQALAGVNLRLATCRELFRRGRHDEALAEMGELQAGVNREHDELRGYIRSLVDMDSSRESADAGAAARVSVQADFNGSAAFVEHVLLILLEGTRNVRRHARARSAVIRVGSTAGELTVAIDDDGVGFPAGAERPWSMVSRVAECGGRLQLGANGRRGGLVVHMSSGFSAIIAALLLGPRRGFGKDPMPPHSLPLCMIGAGLLWTGWFGFNAGSALSASPLASLAFLNTSTATSTAVVAWAAIEWLHRGKPTALGGATAAVAGLVAITPACGNVAPLGSICVGAGVAVVSYLACTFLKPAAGYDDSLDVFGVHALGGAWGALASGIFAVTLGSGIESNAQQILVQLKGIVFVAVFAPVATVIIFAALKLAFGSLRVSDEEEAEGLDVTQHQESAYSHSAGSMLPQESLASPHAVFKHGTKLA